MNEHPKEEQKLDIMQILHTLLHKKKLFLKVWGITFVLSCLWIFPQPRFYTTEVSIAPESASNQGGGSLASLASSFGMNIGNGSTDAIYPQLYPDLFKSTDFLVSLFDVTIRTKDGEVNTDYYTYLKEHQKRNWLLLPLDMLMGWIKSFFTEKESPMTGKDGKRFDPFQLTKKTTDILDRLKGNVKCSYSRTTDVVTISVTDQDPLVCALMADSIKEHLQVFITDYRTKKSRVDYEHYKKLTQEAKESYDKARHEYASYADANGDVILQSVKSRVDELENEMQLRYSVYTALNNRLEEAMAKVQENTPVFTTLTNATVPIKPAGPKRVIFVAAMLFLATIGTIIHLCKKELKEWF